MSAPKKALVTLAIGDLYKRLWNERCKPSWEPYAAKHGYDIVVIDDYIDPSPRGRERSPHWQKCLILEHPRVSGYDHAVWLDSDIVINPATAPCIVTATNSEKVGAVLASDFARHMGLAHGEERLVRFNRNPHVRDEGVIAPARRYERAGLAGDVHELINTGVLVYGPQHRDLLRRVYDEGVENPHSAKENVPLSYQLLKARAVTPIDPRFNCIFDYLACEHYPFLYMPGLRVPLSMLCAIVNTALANFYFVHFLEGATRQFITLALPGHDVPDVYALIRDQIGDQVFIIGQHSLE